jgi:hypothetical protein
MTVALNGLQRMSLKNPVVVYTAITNLEAHVICDMLIAAGIEAALIEDASQMSQWGLGALSRLHRPKVYVDAADVDRARPHLAEYERRQRREETVGDGPLIHVVCEECRRTTTFPASLRGRVEECSHCAAYVDVGDDPGFDDWQVLPEGGEDP